MGEKRIRLLIVEDSPEYRYLLQYAFLDRQTCWDLMVAQTGEEALRILFAEEVTHTPLPELVLLDWNLPMLSGKDVLQRMKTHPKLRRIPTMIFSSSETEKDIHAAYDLHANGYITKPSNANSLAETIEIVERFWTLARLPKVMR